MEVVEFPIWKRASIATEPRVRRSRPLHILIDTATREGMSGAPVLKIVEGAIGMGSSRSRRFVGVYSSRLGDREMEAQLGKVRDASLLEAIVHGAGKGSCEVRARP